MPGPVDDGILRYLRGLAPAARPDSDRELLGRFATRRDESAFAILVERHGAMVRAVCGRVLADAHAADDAFQATFLVLARKAGALSWHESIAGWLHQVAFRIARKARAGRCDLPLTEAVIMPDADPVAQVAQRELRDMLDEELARLPPKYRLPLVLCYLEGRTNDEAARQLGWTKGTVSGRLSRARDLLRPRLLRRGLASATAGAALPAAQAAPVAAPLLQATLKAVPLYAAHSPAVAAVASFQALVLSQGALRAMSAYRLKIAAAVLLALLLGAGAVVGFHALAGQTEKPGTPVTSGAGEPAKRPKTDLEKLQGVWRLVALESGGKALTGEPLEMADFRKLVVDKDWFTEVDGDFGPGWKIKLDAAKSPRTIDWFRNERIVVGGVATEKDTLVAVGIYEFDGERLRIAQARGVEPADRPTGFKTRPGAAFTVRVFERGTSRAAVAKRPEFVQAEVTLYLGRDGVPEPPQILKKTVKDKAVIARLADCFQGVATGKKNRVAGGWLPRLEVTFEGGKGEKTHVLAIWTNWNEGAGDWKVTGNLMKQAGELFGVPRLTDQGALMDPWQVVSVEQGGKKKAAPGALTVTDFDFRVILEGKTTFAADDYSLDPAQKPKAIDFTLTDGGTRKEVPGIYVFKDDTLMICVDRSGRARPAAFETRAENPDQVLWVSKKRE